MSLSINLIYDLASGDREQWDELVKLATTHTKARTQLCMNGRDRCPLYFSKELSPNFGEYDSYGRGGIVIYLCHPFQLQTAMHEFCHHLQYQSYCDGVEGWHSYYENTLQEKLFLRWKDEIPQDCYAASSAPEMAAEAFMSLKSNTTLWEGDKAFKMSWKECFFKNQPRFRHYFIPGMLPPPLPSR